MAELTRGALEVGALLAAAPRGDCGAVVLFLGTTRDHHDGRAVERLAYEAYEPMAVDALAAIEREAAERFAIASCRIAHRLGDVPVAEPSVAVVVVAPHRAAAFDASRWAMDALKHNVPIWKQEHYAEGEPAWVEGHQLEPPAGEVR